MRKPKSFWKMLYTAPINIKGIKTIPAPFPGAYPTRWCLAVMKPKRLGEKIILWYIGKPNQAVARQIERLSMKDGWIRWVEFDQRNAISAIDQRTGEERVQAKDWNGDLWKFYYPFHAGTLLQIWVGGYVKTARLKTTSGQVPVYMPPGVSAAAMKGHEEWLKKANIALR